MNCALAVPRRPTPGGGGAQLARTAHPFGIFVFGLGLAMFGIAAAGMVFQLFAAPPEEPISGAFAECPWVEATRPARPDSRRAPPSRKLFGGDVSERPKVQLSKSCVG